MTFLSMIVTFCQRGSEPPFYEFKVVLNQFDRFIKKNGENVYFVGEVKYMSKLKYV